MNVQFAISAHVLAYMHLATGPSKSEVLANSVGTNASFIRRLLLVLNEAGLTSSVIGSSGGSRLAKPAGEISLLDVYRALGQSKHLPVHAYPSASCPVGSQITRVMTHHISSAERQFEEELSGTTIADLAAEISQPYVEIEAPPRIAAVG